MRLTLVAAIAIMIASVFALLTMFVPWATLGEGGFTMGFHVDGLHADNDGDAGAQYYRSESLDESDGIGLARTGSVMLIIGTVITLAGGVLYQNTFFTDRTWMATTAAVTAAVGMLVYLVALILFPIGVGKLAEELAFFGDATWHVGLYFGIVATLCMLTGVITHMIHIAKTNGFKLELADNASFD